MINSVLLNLTFGGWVYSATDDWYDEGAGHAKVFCVGGGSDSVCCRLGAVSIVASGLLCMPGRLEET